MNDGVMTVEAANDNFIPNGVGRCISMQCLFFSVEYNGVRGSLKWNSLLPFTYDQSGNIRSVCYQLKVGILVSMKCT